MTNKLIKKSIALIGGVMMLANVALPSFTYADEPSQPAWTPAAPQPATPAAPNLKQIVAVSPAEYTLKRGQTQTDLTTLPSTVTLKDDADAEHTANVTWNFDAVRFNEVGTYDINGTVTLPSNMTNTNSVSTGVTVRVIVEKNDVDIKTEKVAVATLQVKAPAQPEGGSLNDEGEDNTVYYETWVNAYNTLDWKDSLDVPMVNCSFKGADSKNYNNQGVEVTDENQACNLFIKNASIASDKLAEKNQKYTLTVDFGDNVKKVYNLTFIRRTVKLTLKDGDKDLENKVIPYKGEKLPKLEDPKKTGYKFLYWTSDKAGNTKYNLEAIVENNLTLYAQWKKRTHNNTSTSGGGSSSSASNTTTTTGAQAQSGAQLSGVVAQTGTQLSGVVATGTNEAKVVKTLESLRSGAVDQAAATPEKAKQLEVLKASLQSESNTELRDAYTYAYLRGMTTQPTIQQADLHRGLTRAEMAKMMSVFAVKVLGKSPVLTGTVDYKDLNQVNGDLTGYIQQAYQLQIMGIDAKGNPIANFNPNAQVTRAEFATVLSRVLYGDKNNQEGSNFAEKHLEALKAAGILKDTTPTMKELRGWVMLMLMRAEGVK